MIVLLKKKHSVVFVPNTGYYKICCIGLKYCSLACPHIMKAGDRWFCHLFYNEKIYKDILSKELPISNIEQAKKPLEFLDYSCIKKHFLIRLEICKVTERLFLKRLKGFCSLSKTGFSFSEKERKQACSTCFLNFTCPLKPIKNTNQILR